LVYSCFEERQLIPRGYPSVTRESRFEEKYEPKILPTFSSKDFTRNNL